MIYPINSIYTRVKKSVASLCTNTSRTYKSTPQKMPFLYMKQLGNPSCYGDMDGNENAIKLSIEVKVYADGIDALNMAEKIFKLANDEMLKMGFERYYGIEQLENLQDTSITQLIARYRKTVCENEFK